MELQVAFKYVVKEEEKTADIRRIPAQYSEQLENLFHSCAGLKAMNAEFSTVWTYS
jgi:hypothetical protein